MTRRTSTALLALAALAAAACGSSGSGGTGKMSVHLVDGPGDYQKIELDIQKVEIHSDATGWTTLGTPNKVVDLVKLTNGVAETLADGATLPAGTYGQLRLVLGPNNSVTLLDGSKHDLTVPSGMQSGVKLDVHFDVAPGTTKDVFIDFVAHNSVFVHEAGMSGKYILRPVVRAFDRVVTGSVAGKLTDATTGAGLPGALVMAETLDGTTGAITVARSVKTLTDGSYTLDLLPVGSTYHVVSQPVVAGTTTTTSYVAQASNPIELTAAAPTAPWSAAFAVAQTGTASGNVTAVATTDQADTVVATASFPVGLTPRTLVVRTIDAQVASGVETWSMDLLPAGTYTWFVSRRTVDATTGAETVQAGAPVTNTVPSGGATTVNLVAP